jgi:hypothetical protein
MNDANVQAIVAERDALREEVSRLQLLLNTPELVEFSRGVILEAAHQRERWDAEHDGGKTDADWYWLIGYLGGKALFNPPNDMLPIDAKLHRIITVAAAAANWHAAVLGQTNMRPGLDPSGAIIGALGEGA